MSANNPLRGSFTLDDLDVGASLSDPIQIKQYALTEAERRGLDPQFVDRLFKMESGYRRTATSEKGAKGVGQLMPGTAKRFGVADPYDAKQNVDASLSYLEFLRDKFGGDPRKIAAGYFAGEGKAEAALRNPRGNPKTTAYVKNVAGGGQQAGKFSLNDLDQESATLVAAKGTQQPAPPSPQVQANSIIDQMLAAQDEPQPGSPLELTDYRNTQDRPPIPEPPEALAAQMEALTKRRGSRKAVLVTPGEAMPEVPQGYEVTRTSAGTFIHRPNLKPDDVIRAVDDGSYQSLLGIHEPKGPTTTTAVVARDEQGKELFAALASPQNITKQAKEVRRQFPKAKIRVEQPEQVIAGRQWTPPSEFEQSFKRRRAEIEGADPTVQFLREITPQGRQRTTAPQVSTVTGKPVTPRSQVQQRGIMGGTVKPGETPDQAFERAKAVNPADVLKAAAQSLTGVGTSIAHTPATLIADLSAAISGETPATQALRGAMPQAQRSVQEALPLENPEALLTSVLPSAVASTLPYLLAPGLRSVAGLGALTGAGESFQESQAAGADKPTQYAAAIVNALGGATEALGAGGAKVRALAAPKRGILQAAKREGAQEFFQGGGQRIIQNLSAQGYDPNRPLDQGALEEALLGLFVGGVVGGGAQVGVNMVEARQKAKAAAAIINEEMKGASDAQEIRVNEIQVPERGVIREAGEGKGGEGVRGTGEGQVRAIEPSEVTPAQEIQVEPPKKVINHDQLGKVEVEGKRSDGRLNVTDEAGEPHVIKNPRTQGNQRASYVSEEQRKAAAELIRAKEQASEAASEEPPNVPRETSREAAAAQSEAARVAALKPDEVVLGPEDMPPPSKPLDPGKVVTPTSVSPSGAARARLGGEIPEGASPEGQALLERAKAIKETPNVEPRTVPELLRTGPTRVEEAAKGEVAKAGEAGKGKTEAVEPTKPAVRFYRGTNVGDMRRIDEPFDAAKGKTFVSRKPESAKNYGESIEEIIAKPDAKILYEEDAVFWKLIGRRRPANSYIGSAIRKGETMVDVVNDAIRKAEAAGYDAVSFGSDADIGTILLNEKAFNRAKTTADVKPRQAAPTKAPEPITALEERGTGEGFLKEEKGSLDPEVLEAWLTLATYHIEAGAREFPDFVKRMVEDGGERARAYAPILYARARDFVDTGKRQDITGIKNAITTSERALRGQKELIIEARRKTGPSFDEAMRRVDSGEVDPRIMAQEIAERRGPVTTGITAEEQGVLLYDRMRIGTEYKLNDTAIADAIDAGAPVEQLLLKREALEHAREMNDIANRRVGYEWGYAGRFRQLLVREDYSLLNMVSRVKATSGKSEIPEKIRLQLEKVTGELETTGKALEAAEKRAEGLQAQLDTKATFEEVRRQENIAQRRQKRATTKAELETEFAALREQFTAARKETHVGSGLAALDPEGKLTPLLGKMFVNRVKLGINTVEGVVDSLMTEMGDQLGGWTRREVMEAVSGYNKERHQTRDVIQMEINQLRRDIRSILKQEDIAEGKAIDPRVKATRTRAENRVKELEGRVARGEYAKAKREPIRDPEVEKLRLKSSALQRQLDQIERSQRPGRWWREASSLRKASMLMSPKTWGIRNPGGNTMWQVFDEMARVPGAIFDTAASTATKQRSLSGPSPVAILDALAKGGKKGIKEAGHILKSGATPEELAELQFPQEVNTGSKIIDVSTQAVFRIMTATDRVFYNVSYRRNLTDRSRIQATNEAREGKIEPRDLGARMRTLRDTPTAELRDSARHDALVATFNNNNRLSDGIKRARSALTPAQNFAVDLVIPFDRTPTNVVARVLEATPLGYFKTGAKAIKLARGITDKAMSVEEQRAMSQSFGRATVGSAVLLLGWKLASEGLLTGAIRPGNKTDDDEEPASIKNPLPIGPKWVNVGQVSPIGNLLVLGAGMWEDSQKKGVDAFGAGLLGAGGALMEQPILKSTSMLGQAMQGQIMKGAARTIFSFVPASALVREAAYLTDTEKRKPSTERNVTGLKEQFQQNIPVWRKDLPVRAASIRQKAIDTYRKDGSTKLLDDAVSAGEITPQRRTEIINEAKLKPLQSDFKNLSIEDKFKAYRGYNQAQREEVRQIFVDSWGDARGAAERSRTGKMGRPRKPSAPPVVLDRIRREFADVLP